MAKLGLKKETADMYYQKLNDKWTPLIGQPLSYDGLRGTYLNPAWSLHRLMEMYVERYLSCSVNLKDFTYEWLINEIEIHIKDGDFNKDYLEE